MSNTSTNQIDWRQYEQLARRLRKVFPKPDQDTIDLINGAKIKTN